MHTLMSYFIFQQKRIGVITSQGGTFLMISQPVKIEEARHTEKRRTFRVDCKISAELRSRICSKT